MKMKVWGGYQGNYWGKILGDKDGCRLIVKAPSKAEAVRVLNDKLRLNCSMNHFNHFFSESGNNLDLALCSVDAVTVWVYNDDVCLRIYDERSNPPVKAGVR